MKGFYERIGGFDNNFLFWETENTYMHIAGTYTFEAGPLKKADGSIDVDSIKAKIAGGLHLIPRYRQKLAYIGSVSRPLWVDDEKFNIDYHFRHTSLPKPGTKEQLKTMSAWIMEQHLDLKRALWEIWIIEGLEGDRFSIIAKVHHCMVDGITGLELLTIMMTLTPEVVIEEPKPYHPRPIPTQADMIIERISENIQLPFQAIKAAAELVNNTEMRNHVFDETKDRILGLGEYFESFFHKRSNTPFNKEIGSHRHFDWLSMQLADIKKIRHVFGGSLNDVVLAIITSAVQKFLQSRNIDTDEIDFRVMTPVSMRSHHEHGEMGNRVASWTVELPMKTKDAVEVLKQIENQTTNLKKSRQALGAETLTQIFNWTPSGLLAVGARHQYKIYPWNMVVTNVPGPHSSVYLNGCKMLEAFPHVPLMNDHGLNIALMSYDKRLFWCFNADYDLMPDLEKFSKAVQDDFEVLLERAKKEGKHT